VPAGDPDSIQELFSEFGRVSVRRMFGGAGIFADGLMIGLIADGDIYLKADNLTVPDFEREGLKPFTYGAKRRRIVMSYWRMPDRLLDDPDELARWARAALGAAKRSAANKTRPKSKRRPAKQAAKREARKPRRRTG
jgi:DNA transformation protein